VENAMTRLRKNEKGMILAIDMGNTNIVIGCVDDNGVLFEERLSTDFSKTELEYAIGFKTVLELYNIDSYDIKGAIMSSVVPQLSNIIKSAVEKTIGISPLIVGPGIKTGLNILMDQPRQVGSDQIVDAVAALKVYGAPSIIIDMGTATTMSVVDENENYIGGVILPGIRVSVDSLVSRTAQLPRIALDAPKSVMGKNTIDCMKSGVVYGNASCIDGMIDRMIDANGFNKNGTKAVTIVATGGLSEVIIPHCRHDIKVDPGLLLKGLSIIYDKNVE
jgi:pantothenate kinase, type III